MRCIHLIHDDKFFDTARALFDPFPQIQNYYNDLEILASATDQDVIVIHYLDENKARIINNIKSNPSIFWIAYGAELYASKYYPLNIYYPLTRFINTINPVNTLRKLRNILRPNRLNEFAASLHKINFVATPIPEETILFKKYLPGLKAEEIQLRYGSLENILGNALNRDFNLGDGILVANSNTPSSNHADAFRFIKRNNWNGRNVLVPLSYGNEKIYRLMISFIGRQYFGNHLVISEKFMEINEYVPWVSSCRTAVFMHERQQAIGNIIICLWLGMKIYLSRNNPCYSFFKKSGIQLFSIQDREIDLNEKLPSSIKIHNQQILQQLYGKEPVLKLVEHFIATHAKTITENIP